MEAVRIYLRSGAGFIEVATLSPIAPPRMLEGSFEIPEVDMEHGGGEGLYLALVQGGKRWILTKDYRLAWLRPEEMDEFDFKLDSDESQILREPDFVMDFEIVMAPSPVLNDVVAMIKPSICNFTILKKVEKLISYQV